jgi:hypothetical protein
MPPFRCLTIDQRIEAVAGASHLAIHELEGRVMSTFESYHDVLSESGHRGHIVSSGWIVVAAIAVALMLFA